MKSKKISKLSVSFATYVNYAWWPCFLVAHQIFDCSNDFVLEMPRIQFKETNSVGDVTLKASVTTSENVTGTSKKYTRLNIS